MKTRKPICLHLLALLVLARLARAQVTFRFQVVENSPTNSVVGSVGTSTTSTDSNYRFSDSVAICEPYFAIHSDSGEITVLNQSNLDREAIGNELECLLQYTDQEGTNEVVIVIIEILDLNDCTPSFVGFMQPHFHEIPENGAVPTTVLRLQPTDDDEGINGTTAFSITSGNEDGFFAIEIAEGEVESTQNRILVLIRQINFEILTNGGVFNLTITITDLGVEPLSFEQRLNIEVTNLEDEAPTFETTSYFFNVTENYPVGSKEVFARVRADSDSPNGQLNYSMCVDCASYKQGTDRTIGVNQTTGGLFLKIPVDYESLAGDIFFTFEIEAINVNSRQGVTTVVRVDVLDVNEHPPFFECRPGNQFAALYTCGESENVNNSVIYIEDQYNAPSQRVLLLFVADDDEQERFKDINMDTLTYRIEPEEYPFTVNFIDRRIFGVLAVNLQINGTVDRERVPVFLLTFTMENVVQPSLRTDTTITIIVRDINDNTPSFSQSEYQGNIFERSPGGLEVVRVFADDPDEGENGTVIYSISGVSEAVALDWFEISLNGMISVGESSSIDYLSLDGRSSVTLTITASDNGTESRSSSATVAISILPPTTFILGSYQEYSSDDFSLLADASANFYLEFRSSESSVLLAYQQGSGGVVFSVELREGAVVARSGDSELVYSDANVSTDAWHAIYVQRTDNQVTSLRVAPVRDAGAQQPLLQQELTVQRCVNRNQQDLDHQLSLYIGGANIFHLSPQPPQHDFVGGIRNVVVGGVQVDPTCPAVDVNTELGVIRTHSCPQLECAASQCVDYGAEESYCQCPGAFSRQACTISENSQSYAPIRFHGNSMASLNLGYGFFYDLALQGSRVGPVADTGAEGGDQAPSVPGQRRRREGEGQGAVQEVVQEVDVHFRLVELRSSVLLYSRTSTSTHLIRLNAEGDSSLIYSIWQNQLQTPVINLTLNFPLQTRMEYRLRASAERDGVTLTLSDTSRNQSWEDNPVTPFAQQPQTAIGIGGAPDDVNASLYFMGCITRVSVDGVALPLNGLLGAADLVVPDPSSVDSFCNLCDLEICPDGSECVSNDLGGARCDCEGDTDLADNGNSCLPRTLPTSGLVTPSSSVSYIAGGAAGAALLLAGIVAIIIIVVVRRRQERQKSTYNISSNPMGSPPRNKPSNVYTPTIPKRRPSLTSNADGRERTSSVSTYQEHDKEPEFESPMRHTSKRVRHTSVESGIKLDTDQEASIGCGGIPQMEDSGHEVNSTDSARSVESEDIASSGNEQLPPRPSIMLRMVTAMPSPDQYTRHSPLSPRTPLTPKEQKIMIPLRPASTNLSQSEFGDEATDIETESYNTRVSSSSGVGGSMQNQGRGSDSEKSGCNTPQWYKASTTSDTERENERIQANHSYYPLGPNIPPPEGTRGNYQPRLKPAPVHPPLYYSPPSFSDHMAGGYGRPRSKSMHAKASSKSPLANTPQRSYENYPHVLAREGLRNGRLVYDAEASYSSTTSPRHDRQLSDPRALRDDEDQGYPPTAFTRQYSDPRIPHNGNYCIPRKHTDAQQQALHSRQMSDPRQSSEQQTQDSILVQPRSSYSMRHIPSPSTYTGKKPMRNNGVMKDQHHYYTLGRMLPDHLHYPAANQGGRSFSSGDSTAHNNSEEPFQTLSSLSKIDPISKWDAQARMKIAVDHIDPCHLLSGPYLQFEDVSTDPSVVESQLTMDESMMGDQQTFESQGGGEGTAMLDPLDMRLARLAREDEMDSILTDSDIGRHEMNHFPSADCSSQYTATIVAGSTSTSGESTPKLQKVFIIPPSQQSFDV